MSEISKLEQYLIANGYEYTRKILNPEDKESLWVENITIRDKEGNYLWDVSSGILVYGGQLGYLEGMGYIFPVKDGDVLPYLTADDVIGYLEQYNKDSIKEEEDTDGGQE